MVTSVDLVWRRVPTCPNREDVVREVLTADGASRVKHDLSDPVLIRTYFNRITTIRPPFRGSFRWSWWSPSWPACARASSSTRAATRFATSHFVQMYEPTGDGRFEKPIATLVKHVPLLFHSGAQDGEGRRRGPAPPQAHLPLLLLRALLPGVHGIVEGEEAEQIEGLPAEGDAHVIIGDHVSCLGHNTIMHQIHNQFHFHGHGQRLRSHSSSKLRSFARMPSHEMIAFPSLFLLPSFLLRRSLKRGRPLSF